MILVGNILTDGVIKFIEALIDLLPSFNIGSFTFPSVVLNIINAAHFFLPMDHISILFSMSVGITLGRLTLAIIYRIKSFIPSMGN